jgi:hypothetical protein
MKYIKRFNEAIVDYNNSEIDSLMKDIEESNKKTFTIAELAELAEPYNIEIVNYDTFYDDLPQRDKKTAPPRNTPFFALVNPVTKKPRIVFNMYTNIVYKSFFKQVPIGDILKHEQIHIGQYSRRPMETPLPEPKDQKSYFSNKDEVMAFAFSIAKEVIAKYPNIKTPNEGIIKLTNNGFRLYTQVKMSVDARTLKRYNKYIYLYLEDIIKK